LLSWAFRRGLCLPTGATIACTPPAPPMCMTPTTSGSASWASCTPNCSGSTSFRQRVYLAEFGLTALMRAAAHTVRYRPLPAFPPVLRDIAIVVAQSVPYAALEQTIREAGGAWLESLRLFDRYTGAPVPEGHHSLAFSLVFRDPNRTLTDEEVNAQVEAIFTALEAQHGAQRRA
jgi:phenylalanyl-tRNA synthetase beta chain